MTKQYHGLSRLDQLAKACLEGEGPNAVFPRVLGRALPRNPVHIKNITHKDVIDALTDLANGMGRNDAPKGPAEAGMTFLGQFVDHDITLDATSALGSRIDPAQITNVRTPNLDLDCVYGAGPEASPHLYGNGAAEKFLVFGRAENHLDLARTCAGKALIGDPRNDENIIVAQIQSIFIRLHNILMTYRQMDGDKAKDIATCAMEGMDPDIWKDHVVPSLEGFEQVRRFIRLHYQHIVWHELLPSFVDQACIDAAHHDELLDPMAPVMPVEFTGAAYRFGHATTQFQYAMKRADDPLGLFATLGFGPRPKTANMEYDMMFAMQGGGAHQHARPVCTGLGLPLLNLPFVHDPIHLKDVDITLSKDQSRNLALRNMIRDRYTYELVSGQKAAHLLGVADRPDIPKALADKGFKKTPLWFYCLQEAEEFGNGKLTGVGGALVAAVFANLLKRDKASVFHVPHFKPWHGFGGNKSLLAGIIAFVEKHYDDVEFASCLRCGPTEEEWQANTPME
tara:strand:- start:271 stop:1797 length:1527 start_codon:yes stop_codon:yes gene_type:complete